MEDADPVLSRFCGWRIMYVAFLIATYTCSYIAVEVIGFGARATAHKKTASMMPYCIQNVFILLGPTLFAATVYMTLGRIVRSIRAEKYSIVRVNWLTKIFVTGDVLSFMIQGTAGGLMASGGNTSLGHDLVIVGLVIQVVMFALFIITAVIVQMRIHQYPTRQAFDDDLPWKKHLYTLYTVSLLIMTRSIFRVVDYAMGQHGYPLTHEWTLYVFDAPLMFVVMVIYGVFFPSQLQLQRQKREDSPIGLEDSGERL